MTDDSRRTHRRFGALPPPDKAWQIGKTAASIAFVNEATAYLDTCVDTDARARLERAIDDVKHGRWALTSRLTIPEFLETDP